MRNRKNTAQALKRELIRVLFGILLFSITSHGQSVGDIMEFGFDEQGYGIKARSMGNAFIPIADDFSALYWNPAGLGQLKHSQLYFEGGMTSFYNSATFYGTTVNDYKNFFHPKAIGFALPLPVERGSLVLAFGYQRKKNLDDYTMFTGFNQNSNDLGWFFDDDDEFFPFDKDVRQTERITTKGGLDEYAFGASISVSPNLLIGISAAYLDGNYKYELEFLQEDIDNIYTGFPANYNSYLLNQTIETKMKGWSVKVGALAKIFEYIRLGVMVDVPISMEVHEIYSESDILNYDDGYIDETIYEPGQWVYQIYYPPRFHAGIALKFPFLTLSTSASYTELNQSRFEIPEGKALSADYLELLDENRIISSSLRPSYSLHGGVELNPGRYWPKFRAGYQYKVVPQIDTTGDLDRQYYSAGIAFPMGEGFEFSLNYILGIWNRASSDALTPGVVDESIMSHNFGLGISFGL